MYLYSIILCLCFWNSYLPFQMSFNGKSPNSRNNMKVSDELLFWSYRSALWAQTYCKTAEIFTVRKAFKCSTILSTFFLFPQCSFKSKSIFSWPRYSKFIVWQKFWWARNWDASSVVMLHLCRYYSWMCWVSFIFDWKWVVFRFSRCLKYYLIRLIAVDIFQSTTVRSLFLRRLLFWMGATK